jgi:phosphoribosyl-ATP pyrophosphohydrolase
MIVPSVDIQGGNAVQLVGGEKRELDAGDPRPITERFARVGEVAVIDLDAALGEGENRSVIEALCRDHPCRVGGGIRDLASAQRWLDAGARRVILGTAARPELLSQLPRERTIAALDARHGEVVVEGWRTRTGASILDRMVELRDHVGGFLVTFVEREGRMGGTDLERVRELVEAAGNARVTIAGGVTTPEEVATLDSLGADAQIGMAIYTGRLGLAEAVAAPLKSDRADGLWATVVTDEHGRALGLCWSNLESLERAIDTGRGVYWSRRRGLWEKGATSGASQELIDIAVDCDRDALRFRVRQAEPGFCHLERWSCWGSDRGLPDLARRLAERVRTAPEGSYTQRLLEDPELLHAKLREEAGELAAARDRNEVTWEAADLIYFTLVAMARRGVSLEQVEEELGRRSLSISRRPGNAKPEPR